MKIIHAIYNFIVGDMIILVGVLVVALILGIINFTSALISLRVITGPLLVITVLCVLIGTLYREARANRKVS